MHSLSKPLVLWLRLMSFPGQFSANCPHHCEIDSTRMCHRLARENETCKCLVGNLKFHSCRHMIREHFSGTWHTWDEVMSQCSSALWEIMLLETHSIYEIGTSSGPLLWEMQNLGLWLTWETWPTRYARRSQQFQMSCKITVVKISWGSFEYETVAECQPIFIFLEYFSRTRSMYLSRSNLFLCHLTHKVVTYNTWRV